MKILMIGQVLSAGGGMVEVQKGLMTYLSKQGANIECISIATSGASGEGRALYFLSLFRIIALCISNNIDIAHIHMASRGSAIRKIIVSRILSAFNVPFIFHLHSGEFSGFYERLPRIFQRIILTSLSNASYVIVLSNKMAGWCKTTLELSNIVVIKNGCADIQPLQNKAARHRDIIFLGRLNEKKGVDDLIESIKLVSNTHPEIRATIAGDGDIPYYSAIAQKKGILHNLSFTGWLDRESCNQLLKSHKMFILPSYYEGMPMSILEAMSSQTPIIATKVGGIPEIIVHRLTGLLVDPGDVKAIADAILLLLKDEELSALIAKNARTHYELEFSLETMGEKFMDIYNKIKIN